MLLALKGIDKGGTPKWVAQSVSADPLSLTVEGHLEGTAQSRAAQTQRWVGNVCSAI